MPTQKRSLGLRKQADPSTSRDLTDVVLVHGLTGDSEHTFYDKESKCYWPRDLLPNDLPNTRIFTYGYDADIVHFWGQASQSRIHDHANTFLSALANVRLRTETEDRPLIFVAHSMGGLVVEDLLLASKNSAEDHLKQVLEHTIGIAFIGTPFCGSHLAAWAGVLGGISNLLKKSNIPLIEVLKPESEVLARVQQEFHSMIRDRTKNDLTAAEITCFFEDLPFPGVGFVVPKQSALLPGRSQIGIHANHVDMIRFPDDQDPGYQAILGELWRWARDAGRTAKNAGKSTSGQLSGINERIADDSGSRRLLLTESRASQPAFHSIDNSFQSSVSGSGKLFQGSNLQSQGDMNF